MNFDPQILELIQEAKCMRRLNLEVSLINAENVYYRLRPSLKCDDFSALFYISNVNDFVGYVSLLNNETFAVM